MSEWSANDILYHHGIKGQKWGRRRFQYTDGSWTPAGAERYGEGTGQRHASSFKAGAHKALAKVYGMNEKVYSKSNKALSSMNKSAKEQQLAKAAAAQKAADAKANAKYAAKNQKKEAKVAEKERYSQINPDDAKNKQTRRVALDYHNMSDIGFHGKYHTSKKTFAKRYVKTKGDTYSLGKKKAAIALAFIGTQPARSVYIGKGKSIQVTGKRAVMKSLGYDLGSTAIKTNVGYKRAEEKYKKNHAS